MATDPLSGAFRVERSLVPQYDVHLVATGDRKLELARLLRERLDVTLNEVKEILWRVGCRSPHLGEPYRHPLASRLDVQEAARLVTAFVAAGATAEAAPCDPRVEFTLAAASRL